MSNITYKADVTKDIDDAKATELPPNILTLDGFVEVYNNRRYIVKDMYLPDPVTGKILFTISITKLYPGQQTRGHSHAGNIEVYKFERGRGLLLLNRNSTDVKPNYFALVNSGVEHKVINYSESDDLVFLNYYPDRLIRPDVKLKGGSLQKISQV